MLKNLNEIIQSLEECKYLLLIKNEKLPAQFLKLNQILKDKNNELALNHQQTHNQTSTFLYKNTITFLNLLQIPNASNGNFLSVINYYQNIIYLTIMKIEAQNNLSSFK